MARANAVAIIEPEVIGGDRERPFTDDQFPLSEDAASLSRIWLFPRNGGYNVSMSPDGKAVIGYIEPLMRDDLASPWRVTRVDLFMRPQESPPAAVALLLSTMRQEGRV